MQISPMPMVLSIYVCVHVCVWLRMRTIAFQSEWVIQPGRLYNIDTKFIHAFIDNLSCSKSATAPVNGFQWWRRRLLFCGQSPDSIPWWLLLKVVTKMTAAGGQERYHLCGTGNPRTSSHVRSGHAQERRSVLWQRPWPFPPTKYSSTPTIRPSGPTDSRSLSGQWPQPFHLTWSKSRADILEFELLPSDHRIPNSIMEFRFSSLDLTWYHFEFSWFLSRPYYNYEYASWVELRYIESGC